MVSGVFAREWIMDAAKDMPSYLWWDQHGATVPELQAVARMILAQPGSASICERINSERDTPSALVEWDKSKIVKHQ